MENIRTSSLIAPLTAQSKYSVFKRIGNLSLVLLAIIICTNLWLLNSEQAANWHKKQANQLGQSLSNLAAHILVEAIRKNDSKKLTQQLAFIGEDPHVLSASIYDNKGTILANNKIATSVVAIYKLNSATPLVFVKKIKYQDELIGYLRIMLKEEEVMKYHSEYQLQLYQQLIVLMLLAGVGGILIARVFYKFRYRMAHK
ncbi:AhpA/YtjB family protein [Paraglaciecola sp. L3A3]|uniref:AhpA/YtjB family protein n=1 Tax=Paraglaciecola sp. L3A3 TaxID=2686358 RepID=UPI00131CFBBA|nr:AhpA/YtjB family protein [Paraglaciecola sp. L3A3]